MTRHFTPKERALIVEPRLELHSWQVRFGWDLRTFFRIELAGEPVTCAWRTAQAAWAAALRALRSHY